jgi:hypothetical protein
MTVEVLRASQGRRGADIRFIDDRIGQDSCRD